METGRPVWVSGLPMSDTPRLGWELRVKGAVAIATVPRAQADAGPASETCFPESPGRVVARVHRVAAHAPRTTNPNEGPLRGPGLAGGHLQPMCGRNSWHFAPSFR